MVTDTVQASGSVSWGAKVDAVALLAHTAAAGNARWPAHARCLALPISILLPCRGAGSWTLHKCPSEHAVLAVSLVGQVMQRFPRLCDDWETRATASAHTPSSVPFSSVPSAVGSTACTSRDNAACKTCGRQLSPGLACIYSHPPCSPPCPCTHQSRCQLLSHITPAQE